MSASVARSSRSSVSGRRSDASPARASSSRGGSGETVPANGPNAFSKVFRRRVNRLRTRRSNSAGSAMETDLALIEQNLAEGHAGYDSASRGCRTIPDFFNWIVAQAGGARNTSVTTAERTRGGGRKAPGGKVMTRFASAARRVRMAMGP